MNNIQCYACKSFQIMSLLNNIFTKFVSSSFLSPGGCSELMVRNASKKAGASTRNKCRNTPGKRRGIKIYDGQRVPHGWVLSYEGVWDLFDLVLFPGRSWWSSTDCRCCQGGTPRCSTPATLWLSHTGGPCSPQRRSSPSWRPIRSCPADWGRSYRSISSRRISIVSTSMWFLTNNINISSSLIRSDPL